MNIDAGAESSASCTRCQPDGRRGSGSRPTLMALGGLRSASFPRAARHPGAARRIPSRRSNKRVPRRRPRRGGAAGRRPGPNLGRDPHASRSPLVGTARAALHLRRRRRRRGCPLRCAARAGPWSSTSGPPGACPASRSTRCWSQRRARTADVAFLGVVYEDERGARRRRSCASRAPPIRRCSIREGKTAIAYGVAGVPETYFIDRGGRIVGKYAAPLEGDVLARGIALARNGS